MMASKGQCKKSLGVLLIACAFAVALATPAAAQALTITTAEGHSTTLTAPKLLPPRT